MKQGKVWDTGVKERKIEEFKMTLDGQSWVVRRITHRDTVDYERRDLNSFHSLFKSVPAGWENAIDRVIDEGQGFKIQKRPAGS